MLRAPHRMSLDAFRSWLERRLGRPPSPPPRDNRENSLKMMDESVSMSAREQRKETADPGGVPMFRGIDLPGAYRHQDYHEVLPVTQEDLSRWFSTSRMLRYGDADPVGQYVWNARVSKAFLEDIGHVEVLLRNFIDSRLTQDAGTRLWWESDRYPRLGSFRRNVNKVVARIEAAGHEPEPDQIVAGLSLDNWRFLLIPRLEATIWKALISLENGGMPHYPGRSRADFEANVELVRIVRNRASHQEPLVSATGDSGDIERLQSYMAAIDMVASSIDPRAAAWIAMNSRIPSVLAEQQRLASS